ncbi:MAG: ABC transporter permease [Clostridiales bacterium]|nr:ABC transporter permease [Clostridiales bacterium]
MKGYRKYFGQKLLWFFITLVVAVILNFVLPRLMPTDPVTAITGKIASGISDSNQVKAVYEYYQKVFGLDKPMIVQFFLFVKNALKGDFGISFSQYPRTVANIIKTSIGWTLALQIPAILVGWIIGNVLGAVAAYKRGAWDKAVMPFFMFLGNVPAFAMAIILLVFLGVRWKVLPTGGAYSPQLIPNFSWKFISSVIYHYWMPFLSIVLISIGGQAIGMRSMSIYELNADYVKYARFLGIKDGKIVRYVFRNAMLPQVTGLAMSLGTSIGGALVAETIFNYPGLGSAMLSSVTNSDYPLISATTLMITIMVLLVTLLLDVIYAFIDPRVKAAQFD